MAVNDLNLERLWVVYPGNEQYSLADKIVAMPLSRITNKWDYS